jgi:(1->4)-alpha-D-glucan 1-alpha-D-glucosylmutase
VTELRCTYRLQLGPGLGFDEAERLVPYLADLGVSHLYLPPSFQARAGSTHGYDVVDPTSISSELGGEEAFRSLVGAARGAGLGVILDIVPNHMAVDDANRYWSDEELRPKFFDIDHSARPPRHRRFFDIDHLAGVRQEDPEVFEETHRLALALVRDGLVDGLRIDHPDGMADPAGYLRRLAEAGVEHVWVEKILDPGEHLRDWPVEGTVGYEFLNDVQALFVDRAGEEALSALDPRDFGTLAFAAKLEQASTTFQHEVDRLNRVHAVDGVERLLASLPVYRTYDGGASEEDRWALEEAGLPDLYDGKPAEWVTRFQQTTPPVMAKGVEDTAFYRYVRLLALNDVGGDPSRFGISVEQFHEANLVRQERFPRNLLITQTHDTKRSGDVRARIGALAGLADEYVTLARQWLRRGSSAPDEVEQLFAFQTMLGAHPIAEDRVRAYFEKALREAKRNTNWIEPDEDYERRVADFALEVPSLPGFAEFAEKVAEAGHRSAMAQTLLKLTAPGVPDIYQGDEIVTLNLVDPDNRREVDWAKRRAMLDGSEPGEPRDREKLDLVRRALALRAERPEAFAGSYEPLDAGPDVCAYVRGGSVLVVAVLREAGQDATIEGHGRARSITGGRSYALADLQSA